MALVYMRQNSFSSEFRAGAVAIAPILLAYIPIAALWGTLAAGKGFSPFEAFLMSAFVYAGSLQFVAVDLWKEPLPIAVMVITALLVNLRHMMMSASISRHMGEIKPAHKPFLMFLLTDEAWATAEKRALDGPLSLGFFLGCAFPIWPTWIFFSVVGTTLGKALGNPAALGLDFAFAAMFLAILVGFWKGPRTGAVITASALGAIAAKLMLPGAWFILVGGLAGVAAAAAFYREG